MTSLTREQAERIRAYLHQLAGSASLCWTPEPTGVFLASSAAQYANDAYVNILALLAEEDSPPPSES